MKPSVFQEAIYNFVLENETLVASKQPRRHLIVDAKAGAGKSSTCLGIIDRLKPFNLSIAYAMFNRQTVDEFKSKAERMGLSQCADINTAHSFGLQALKNSGIRAKIDAQKLKRLVDSIQLDQETFKCVPLAMRLVSLAKDRGVNLFEEKWTDENWYFLLERHFEIEEGTSTENVIKVAKELYDKSVKNYSMIDFADMIYLPLYLNAKPQQYDYVIIDEAQDTNPARRELYKKMLKPWGSMIVVGDPNQAIYGFTGADNDSMEIMKRELNASELPLSVCYRCDKAIIEEAQKLVPGITYRDDAGEGSITSMTYNDLVTNCMRFDLGPDDAILCRLNAPNVRLAFAFIRKGLACRIEGRDIGWSIISLVDKLKAENLKELQAKLDEYRQVETQKALAKGRDAQAELIEDKCDTLEVLIERAFEDRLSVFDLRSLILNMFSDANDPKTPKDILTLSSVHKSKGREWERVFILGRNQFMPSRFAKQDWELAQENNLIYVAVTRAEKSLIYVTDVPK